MTQSRTQDFSVILEVLHTALSEIDKESAAVLSEFTEAGLGDTPAREFWRKLMAVSVYPYPSQLRLQGRAEGEATGQAKSIVTILDDRGISMEDADRERILGCADLETLGTWLHRSLRISAISELFA
jgi:hypothetical protein